jgi:uncharacterized protein (TIGR02466 family)
MSQTTLAPPAPEALQFVAAEFEVRTLFPTPFVVAPVHDHQAIDGPLKTIILARAATTPGVRLSNSGGWQSTDDVATWGGKPARLLLDAAWRLADSLTAMQTPEGLRAMAPEWRMNAWANVNRHGDFNHPHHHPAAFWSGIYWVDTGDAPLEDEDADPVGGELELTDPRGVVPAFYAPTVRMAVKDCLSAGGQDFFTPRAGTMVLFPSWLVHAVRPYMGRRQRISVAFNLSV